MEEASGLPFTAEGHSSRLIAKMGVLRNDHRLCDVVLKVGKRDIHAHRLVLSACSTYFCAMFTNKMLESEQECIVLSDLDETAVEELVDFAYTARINIHEDNVQALLKAAAILQLPEIVAACCEFLGGQLHPTNCLGIAAFAEAHGCVSLGEAAIDYVRDHFLEVMNCEEFVQLSFANVKLLLSSDYIHATSEEAVFESLHRWLQHDLPRRGKHAYELLRCIRLPLLRPIFLAEQVYQREVFKTDLQCTELIMNAMIYHAVPEKRPHLKEVVNDNPRKATLGILFVVGGMDNCRNKVSLECFDARKDEWVLLSNSQAACKRLQFGVAILNSRIYVVGGRDGLRTLNSVDSYDPATNTWDCVAPMCSYRHGVGVAAMSGPMYAVGGHDGWSYLSSVERLGYYYSVTVSADLVYSLLTLCKNAVLCVNW